MSEDTTQESLVEESQEATPVDQTETEANEGVEDVVDAQEGTDNSLQSPDEIAEERVFDAIAAQKGWKDPEDMAKAYKEAEAELTRRSQSLRQTQEEAEAMEAVLNGLLDGSVDPSQLYEDEPMGAAPQQDPAVKEIKARLDVRTVADKYPDFAELKEKMSEVLQNTPNKAVFEGTGGVELLYKMAKVEAMDAAVANAKDEGKKEVTLKEVEKVRATVADGTKAKRASQKVFSASEIASMDDATYMANRDEILRQQKEGLIL
jgi:hypothetical protein